MLGSAGCRTHAITGRMAGKGLRTLQPASKALTCRRCWQTLPLVLVLICGVGQVAAQNVATSVSTTQDAIAIAVNTSQNGIYVTTGDNKLTLINGATNVATVLSDPGAANTSGASAMVTYLNNVFVVNKNSNNISAYFAFTSSGINTSNPLQQLFSEPNTNQPIAIVLDPVGLGKLFVANAGSNSVSVFALNSSGSWQLVTSLTGITNPKAMVINEAT